MRVHGERHKTGDWVSSGLHGLPRGAVVDAVEES